MLKVKYTFLLLSMVFIWSLLLMVYTDSFITPFDRLIPVIIPTKEIYYTPMGGSMIDRMTYMKDILESSQKVSNISFSIMIASFVLFSVYLTMVYQQKQRRSRENTLLRLKNQEIARRNEFIRYISATIGHEFKNNLARIKRRLDLLPSLTGDVRESIDSNLENLFADIKVFKKISDEREEELTDFSEIYLRHMLMALSDRYKDMADVTFSDEFYPPSIYASEILLRTVFENLFDNAIKYRKPDQNKAVIHMSCSLDRDGSRSYVRISFRDSGIGMDEPLAEKCFYKRLSTDTGWGEGLYFAKYVIGLHAGKIRVGKEHTAPGEGTEIIINLPFVEETIDV
ncbi:MAG: HAMP domain-containing histidine kinase [Nitrospiraceae bacterium]|nr:MAG: HAMP domain-containing histidine kinase [Nitrospiraceae bacterium]